MTNPTCDWVYDPAGGPGGRWFGGRNSRYRGGGRPAPYVVQ